MNKTALFDRDPIDIKPAPFGMSMREQEARAKKLGRIAHNLKHRSKAAPELVRSTINGPFGGYGQSELGSVLRDAKSKSDQRFGDMKTLVQDESAHSNRAIDAYWNHKAAVDERYAGRHSVPIDDNHPLNEKILNLESEISESRQSRDAASKLIRQHQANTALEFDANSGIADRSSRYSHASDAFLDAQRKAWKRLDHFNNARTLAVPGLAVAGVGGAALLAHHLMTREKKAALTALVVAELEKTALFENGTNVVGAPAHMNIGQLRSRAMKLMSIRNHLINRAEQSSPGKSQKTIGVARVFNEALDDNLTDRMTLMAKELREMATGPKESLPADPIEHATHHTSAINKARLQIGKKALIATGVGAVGLSALLAHHLMTREKKAALKAAIKTELIKEAGLRTY